MIPVEATPSRLSGLRVVLSETGSYTTAWGFWGELTRWYSDEDALTLTLGLATARVRDRRARGVTKTKGGGE